MKIIGFNLAKISSEREENLEGPLEIKQNIHLEEIIKFKSPFSKEDLAKVNFTFSVDYSNLAKVEIKGHLILLPQEEEFKEILKLQKDKQIPSDLKISLINFIMAKCTLKSLNLETEMGLPPHIPLPKISSKQE